MRRKDGAVGSGGRLASGLALALCLILLPVLVINLTLIVQSLVQPEAVPSFLGYKPFIVLTGSMEPVFAPGDLVIVKSTSAENVQEGDIISFREGSAVVTHRVMSIEETDGERRFFTKGDNNNTADRLPVTSDRLEGVYLRRVQRLGSLAMFTQTPMGMFSFIALPLVLFVFYDFSRRRGDSRKARDLEAELRQIRQQLAVAKSTDGEQASGADEAEADLAAAPAHVGNGKKKE